MFFLKVISKITETQMGKALFATKFMGSQKIIFQDYFQIVCILLFVLIIDFE